MPRAPCIRTTKRDSRVCLREHATGWHKKRTTPIRPFALLMYSMKGNAQRSRVFRLWSNITYTKKNCERRKGISMWVIVCCCEQRNTPSRQAPGRIHRSAPTANPARSPPQQGSRGDAGGDRNAIQARKYAWQHVTNWVKAPPVPRNGSYSWGVHNERAILHLFWIYNLNLDLIFVSSGMKC